MKVFNNIIKIAMSIIFVWCFVSALRPYWDKYWLGHEINSAAIYGTKNTVTETRKFLDEKMKAEWPGFTGSSFFIEKDDNDNIIISITYYDEINVFGLTLKELEFTIEKTATEVDAIL
jgi:hypothetical protein